MKKLRIKNRLSYAFLAAAATATIITGFVYGYLHYFCESEDEFSVVNHPLEPLFRSLHIIAVPALTLMLGIFWINHAWPYLQKKHKQGRRTGLVLCISALPMIFSGYFLQVTVSPAWKTAWVWIHDVSSVLWTLGLIFHFVTHRKRKARRQAAEASGS